MRQRLLLLLSVVWGADVWAQVPEPLAEPRPAPVRGWVPAYDAHIRAEAAKVPALRTLPAEKMADFCPRWAELAPDARLQFYADLLFAISGPESGWDRRVMFNETGIIDRATRRQAMDPVTRRPILSEGLLQLSYADMDGYPPAEGLGCRFDWEADRAAFALDLAAGAGARTFHSGHPERSLLNPYAQLTCGVHVLHTLVRRFPQDDFRAAAGRYWSTMRPKKKSHVQVVAALQARESACFQRAPAAWSVLAALLESWAGWPPGPAAHGLVTGSRAEQEPGPERQAHAPAMSPP
ncbi:hypothetical protein [Pyxidicoccus sp. MSG2]|uniref:hypothetical protein n=1 Tax=Pyxidicoccus sp. MSG2 TaxID=2996790 RepID=UPI002271F587|nr:hypothetical protein [Pyxidicoccus sp. MSG2]MCY1019110.1 hypothetical protein [Pyxidicoccus sp. MSG2]